MYTPNWPVALFLLLLHPPGTLYLLTFDCAKTFSLSNVTWKPICSNSLSPPVLHQAPLYLRTYKGAIQIRYYYYYVCAIFRPCPGQLLCDVQVLCPYETHINTHCLNTVIICFLPREFSENMVSSITVVMRVKCFCRMSQCWLLKSVLNGRRWQRIIIRHADHIYVVSYTNGIHSCMPLYRGGVDIVITRCACLSVCLSLRLSLCLSVCLCVCLSVFCLLQGLLEVM